MENGELKKRLSALENRLRARSNEMLLLSEQTMELQRSMSAEKENVSGYRAYAISFNNLLTRTKALLRGQTVFLRSIKHIHPVDPDKQDEYDKDFHDIKAHLAVLKATLRAYLMHQKQTLDNLEA